MSTPVFGPAALAYKISQHPQYWIPLILIFIIAVVGIYLMLPGMIPDPLPPPSEVTGMHISWNSADESSFKKINHRQYYPEMYDMMGRGFASRLKPGGRPIAVVRLVSTGDRKTEIHFFDELVTIDGQTYDRAMPVMVLQMLESTQYDY